MWEHSLPPTSCSNGSLSTSARFLARTLHRRPKKARIRPMISSVSPCIAPRAARSALRRTPPWMTGFSQLNFGPTPAQTRSVVETMLKKGIRVVFAYIADAHDNQEGAALSPAHTFGPGEAAYVKQLGDFNAAFGTFFANLKAAGIDESNTLFIFTPDEGDHFVGGAPSPAGCDGVHVPCTYGVNGVGEVQLDLSLVTVAAGNSTAFSYHFDDAATTYVPGNPDPSAP